MQGGGENSAASLGAPKPDARFFISCAASPLPENAHVEASGAYHHGYESSEERSGDSTHGWDNDGHAGRAAAGRSDLHVADPVRKALRGRGES